MRQATLLAACLALTFASVGAARAQAPEGQSCGGLLCDMGVLGHKTTQGANGERVDVPNPHELPCNDFVCRAFGGGHAAEAAPPPPPAAAEAAPAPMPTKKKIRKHRTAKASAASMPAAAIETAH
jgi:hypothetical protein